MARRRSARGPGPPRAAGREDAKRRERARSLDSARFAAGLSAWQKPGSFVGALWALALALAVLALSFHPMRAADLWWHLASGRLIAAERTVPVSDPFSFSAAGQPWLNHEWLADLIYHLWGGGGRAASLVYWYWAVLLATYLLLWDLCRRVSGRSGASAALSALAAALAVSFLEIRPHLYSLLFYAILLRWIVQRPRLPAALPLLFLVWVQLHGGFVFGLMAIALVVATRAVVDAIAVGGWRRAPATAWRSRRSDLVVLAACAAACLVNPHGWHAVSYPLTYPFEGRSYVLTLTEWLPPFSPDGIRPPLLGWTLGLVAGCAAVLLSRARRCDEPLRCWPALALGALTAMMALRSARFIPLFAISAALLTAVVLAERWPVGKASGSRRARLLRQAVLPTLAVILASVALARFPVGTAAFRHVTSLETFPVDTLDYVEANGLGGRVFGYYGWGGYVSYRSWPRLKVFIDSRADTVYPASTYDDYRRVQYMGPGWIDVVERSGADFFLWLDLPTPQLQRIEQPALLVATGRWREIHRDFVSVLLAREGVALPRELRETRSAYHELALGGAAMRRGDAQAAETHLRLALRLDGGLLAACRNLAVTLAWQNRPADAWTTQQRCQRIFPESESTDELAALIVQREAALRRPGQRSGAG